MGYGTQAQVSGLRLQASQCSSFSHQGSQGLSQDLKYQNKAFVSQLSLAEKKLMAQVQTPEI